MDMGGLGTLKDWLRSEHLVHDAETGRDGGVQASKSPDEPVRIRRAELVEGNEPLAPPESAGRGSTSSQLSLGHDGVPLAAPGRSASHQQSDDR